MHNHEHHNHDHHEAAAGERVLSQAVVDANLDNAVVTNGVTELLGWTDLDIAYDLLGASPDFSGYPIKVPELVAMVADWKKRHNEKSA
jgi:hypothetical protein